MSQDGERPTEHNKSGMHVPLTFIREPRYSDWRKKLSFQDIYCWQDNRFLQPNQTKLEYMSLSGYTRILLKTDEYTKTKNETRKHSHNCLVI